VDESTYQKLVAQTFRRIEDALADVDPDVVEVTSTGDVVTFTFADGSRCILNTQRPTRQLWLAAKSQGWHFNYLEATETWADDRGRDVTLYGQISALLRETCGLDVRF
jgi:CyaY protein